MGARLAKLAETLRSGGRARFEQAARGALAAVLAYVVATWLSSNPQPLLAPLTALLVVEVTLYGTLQLGLLRVTSVVSGVLLAVGFSSFVGFTWWTLGLLIAASLFVGSLLRLGPNTVEVPISAMLVLSVGNLGEESFATGRVTETLIGAGVGALVNGLFASEVQVEPAGAALERLAGALADVLERIARELHSDNARDRARRWLDDARAVDGRVSEVDRELVQAEQSMWLNPRARRARAGHAAPALRNALDGVELAAVSVRGIARALSDLLHSESNEETADTRAGLSALLRSLARVSRAFGQAAYAEMHGGSPLAESRLVGEVEEARSQRAQVAHLLLAETGAAPELWQQHGALLAHVDRMLADIDPQERARARREWQREPQQVLPPAAAGAAQAMGRLRQEYPQAVRRLRPAARSAEGRARDPGRALVRRRIAGLRQAARAAAGRWLSRRG